MFGRLPDRCVCCLCCWSYCGGCTFEIVEPPFDDALLGELKPVSDTWLAEKYAAEKGFSLGFFQPEYIRRSPVALVYQQGKPIAFANIWRGVGGKELSMDTDRARLPTQSVRH